MRQHDAVERRPGMGIISVLATMAVAPWLAEMAWGGIGVADALAVLVFLGPLYGGAAVLIREVSRRTGRGWPTMVLLGIAFGILQAGVVDQSLFNPSYGDYDFQHPLHMPGLDFSVVYLVAFVSGHAIMSIGTPIALVEGSMRRPSSLWLGRKGLALVAVMYLLATVVNHVGVKEEEHFQASVLQVLAVSCVVSVLLILAFRVPARSPRADRAAPPILLVGAAAFGANFLLPPTFNLAGTVIAIVVVAVAIRFIWRWSGSSSWSPSHTFALAFGAALTNLVTPFINDPYSDVSLRTELASDATAAAVSATIFSLFLWLHRRAIRTTDESRPNGSRPQ